MKKSAVFVAVLVGLTTAAAAQYQPIPMPYQGFGTGSNSNTHFVQPYVDRGGQLHSGHYQTNPNNTQFDNFGTRGNYNPYTGQYGTRSPGY